MTGAADIAKLAASLTEAQRRAVLAMDAEPRLPGRETFNAKSAWALCWMPKGLYSYEGWELAKRTYHDGRRSAYHLTDLGLALRAHLDRQP
jgi:hypothetical protein